MNDVDKENDISYGGGVVYINVSSRIIITVDWNGFAKDDVNIPAQQHSLLAK